MSIIGCDFTSAQAADTLMKSAVEAYSQFRKIYDSLQEEMPSYWTGAEADACLGTLEEEKEDVTKLETLLTDMEAWITSLIKNYSENEEAGASYYNSMR